MTLDVGDRRRPGRAGSRHLAGPLPAHGAGAGLPEYRNRWAEASHGYLGRDPVAPAQLRARARAELAANPTTDFRTAKVVKVAADGLGGFEAATETERLAGRRLVLAAGSATSSPRWRDLSSTTGRACSTAVL